MTTVVTPWLAFAAMSGDAKSARSSWVCTSINPGATILPETSTSREPVDLRKPRPDRGDPVAGDSDIRRVARPAGAVDDDAAAQDHIDHREFPALLMSE